MDIVLIAGLWLDSSVWADVARGLEARGHHAVPVDLPGQGDGNPAATLDGQLTAVLAAVDASSGNPFVVGHSAACTLAWQAADARPDKVARVGLIGGFPGTDGSTHSDVFPIADGLMPFPGWEPFEGPDSDDLDDAAKQDFAASAIPVAEGVARSVVRYRDDRRFDVPMVLVCPEFSPEQARKWIDSGEVPEIANAKHVSYVDIDSGHWPMITKPDELARLLAEAAT